MTPFPRTISFVKRGDRVMIYQHGIKHCAHDEVCKTGRNRAGKVKNFPRLIKEACPNCGAYSLSKIM